MTGDNKFMKINDGGYYNTASREEYQLSSKVTNNAVFAKGFTWTQQGYMVSNIYVATLRDIGKGEELLLEYGESYWFDE